jgi:EAL domain-containing protein (putative c-di-GMP-specific phosphodiesterase class I)
VAEGVETEEEQAFIDTQACDTIQGFYVSKPVAAEEVAALMEAAASRSAIA